MVTAAEIKIWGERAGAVLWDEQEQLASFQYDPNFLRNGWDLSPLKMPNKNGARIYRFPELRKGKDDIYDTFKGLPGLLADALPDKYGNQLINAWLVQQGRAENSMNPVEQLCFIGGRAIGALEFEPAQLPSQKTTFNIELSSLVDAARKILAAKEAFSTNLQKDEDQAMKDIISVGTSAGGARPKAVIALNPKTAEVRSGQTNVPKGFEHWLIKLDGVSDAQFGESSGWGRVEYAYYLMAKACGIDIMESRLLEENQRAHFITRRFDREAGNIKHHVQTLCGIQHYDYNNMHAYSYEQLFQTMRSLKLSYPEAEQMFRRMVFNVMAKNCDDHSKNFSFRLKKGERWELSPAYDLCYSYDPQSIWVSQQTLSINEKRKNINKNDLMTIANANTIKKGEKIISEINEIIREWKYFADQANVREDLKTAIMKNLPLIPI
ncbi:MAG: type II toxin-antitoxin system HipA family toxin [Bacteroidales bacterium]|nr:type II toxin-antitoxin system HipA family toxin [Bacteroidales bacterium]